MNTNNKAVLMTLVPQNSEKLTEYLKPLIKDNIINIHYTETTYHTMYKVNNIDDYIFDAITNDLFYIDKINKDKYTLNYTKLSYDTVYAILQIMRDYQGIFYEDWSHITPVTNNDITNIEINIYETYETYARIMDAKIQNIIRKRDFAKSIIGSITGREPGETTISADDIDKTFILSDNIRRIEINGMLIEMEELACLHKYRHLYNYLNRKIDVWFQVNKIKITNGCNDALLMKNQKELIATLAEIEHLGCCVYIIHSGRHIDILITQDISDTITEINIVSIENDDINSSKIEHLEYHNDNCVLSKTFTHDAPINELLRVLYNLH